MNTGMNDANKGFFSIRHDSQFSSYAKKEQALVASLLQKNEDGEHPLGQTLAALKGWMQGVFKH